MPLGNRINNTTKSRQTTISSVFSNTPVKETENVRDQLESNEGLFQVEEPRYCFDDIILNQDTYDAVQDVLSIYEKHTLIFDDWGLATTHKQQHRAGINLYGAPGTGKTMVAHAIAKQLGRKILTVDYSQIESKYVGETSKNLTSMFDFAKKTKSIIFFDEADALLSKRVTNMSNSTDVSVNQTRSVLLLLINDYDDMILFATNFITNYDPAFMRRILSHIRFDLPNEENRLKLWDLYIPKTMPTDVNLKTLATNFNGISGADISNAVFTAALRAARLNVDLVKHIYFEEAIDRIIKSKNENNGLDYSRRTVSEDYVKSQFGGELPK